MDGEENLKITSLFVLLSFLIAILSVYSLNKSKEYGEGINRECVVLKMFIIDAVNTDYVILEVNGENALRHEGVII